MAEVNVVPDATAGDLPRPQPPPRWWPDVVALVCAGGALALALLGPRLLPDTDPFGVDPFSLRLGAVSLALLAATTLRPLRPALPVLLAVAAIVLPFVLWSSSVDLVEDVSNLLHPGGSLRIEYRTGVLLQDALYLVATLGVCAAAVRVTPDLPARLRLLSLRPVAVVAAVGLPLLAALVTLAIPAQVLGRVALPLVILRRDLPLLGPAYALQAAAQELAFRGVLLGTLERSLPPWAANLGQSLLFGLAHIAVLYEGPTLSIVPVTIGLGLVLGWVTQRTGSIWPAVVVHAAVEVGQGYLVLPGLYGL